VHNVTVPVALVKAEQDCFKELFEAVNITRRISEFLWRFQTVGPATGEARRPYVWSRQRGTISEICGIVSCHSIVKSVMSVLVKEFKKLFNILCSHSKNVVACLFQLMTFYL